MKKSKLRRTLPFLLSAAMVITTAGCGNSEDTVESTESQAESTAAEDKVYTLEDLDGLISGIGDTAVIVGSTDVDLLARVTYDDTIITGVDLDMGDVDLTKEGQGTVTYAISFDAAALDAHLEALAESTEVSTPAVTDSAEESTEADSTAASTGDVTMASAEESTEAVTTQATVETTTSTTTAAESAAETTTAAATETVSESTEETNESNTDEATESTEEPAVIEADAEVYVIAEAAAATFYAENPDVPILTAGNAFYVIPGTAETEPVTASGETETTTADGTTAGSGSVSGHSSSSGSSTSGSSSSASSGKRPSSGSSSSSSGGSSSSNSGSNSGSGSSGNSSGSGSSGNNGGSSSSSGGSSSTSGGSSSGSSSSSGGSSSGSNSGSSNTGSGNTGSSSSSGSTSGSGSSSSGSGSTGGSSSSGGSSTQPTKPTHTHTWVEVTTTVKHDEVGHYETKTVSEAYDEPIYEEKYVCNYSGCGEYFDTTSEVSDHIYLAHNNGASYSVKKVQTDTIHHDAVTEQVWVVDTPAWTETVVTGYRCSGCGVTK